MDNLNVKLGKSNKTISDLETKIQTMKSDIASKNKHTKELEKEVHQIFSFADFDGLQSL